MDFLADFVRSTFGIQNQQTGIGIRGDFHYFYRVMHLIIFILSGTGIKFVGKDTEVISNRFHLPMIPSKKFFRIWIVIFIGMFGICCYNIAQNQWSIQINIAYLIISIASFCVIYFFGFGSSKLHPVCLFFSVLSFISLQYIWIGLGDIPLVSEGDIWWNHLMRNFISFYLGWTNAATNLMIGLVLVYPFGMSKKVHLVFFWLTVPLIAVGLLYFNGAYEGKIEDMYGFLISTVYAVIGASLTSIKCLKQSLEPYQINAKSKKN